MEVQWPGGDGDGSAGGGAGAGWGCSRQRLHSKHDWRANGLRKHIGCHPESVAQGGRGGLREAKAARLVHACNGAVGGGGEGGGAATGRSGENGMLRSGWTDSAKTVPGSAALSVEAWVLLSDVCALCAVGTVRARGPEHAGPVRAHSAIAQEGWRARARVPSTYVTEQCASVFEPAVSGVMATLVRGTVRWLARAVRKGVPRGTVPLRRRTNSMKPVAPVPKRSRHSVIICASQ